MKKNINNKSIEFWHHERFSHFVCSFHWRFDSDHFWLLFQTILSSRFPLSVASRSSFTRMSCACVSIRWFFKIYNKIHWLVFSFIILKSKVYHFRSIARDTFVLCNMLWFLGQSNFFSCGNKYAHSEYTHRFIHGCANMCDFTVQIRYLIEMFVDNFIYGFLICGDSTTNLHRISSDFF